MVHHIASRLSGGIFLGEHELDYQADELSEIPIDVCKGLKGIFFDIDDTFTYQGKIYPGAFSALWKAKEAGLLLVPITGRPAGWSDHIARMWPVDGVVGENGAFYFCLDQTNTRFIQRFMIEDPVQRERNRRRLREIFEEIQGMYRNIALASDQPYRECDLAVDYSEDRGDPLSLEDARHIQEIFERHGARAKISSIHVNAWFGDYDKLSMCKIFLWERYRIDLDQEKRAFFFCGDSPNDVPMFAYFPHCAGVAGIRRFLDAGLLEVFPAFLASFEGSFGFEEIVEVILKKRSS